MAEQRLGAGILWAGGDLVALVAVAIACYRWWRADTAFTRAGTTVPMVGDDLVTRRCRRAAVLVTGCGLLAGCTDARPARRPATSRPRTRRRLWRIALIAPRPWSAA